MPHKPGRFDILETDLPVIWVLCQRDGYSLVTGRIRRLPCIPQNPQFSEQLQHVRIVDERKIVGMFAHQFFIVPTGGHDFDQFCDFAPQYQGDGSRRPLRYQGQQA